MPIKILEDNKDGLDPVFEAYRCLKAVFEAGEVLTDEVTANDGKTYVLEFLKLPGSEEIVDLDDVNPLSGLERWIVEQVSQKVE